MYNMFGAYHMHMTLLIVVEVESQLLTKEWKVGHRGVGNKDHNCSPDMHEVTELCWFRSAWYICSKINYQHRICWATKIGHPLIPVNPR